jgi:hypothetical protein
MGATSRTAEHYLENDEMGRPIPDHLVYLGGDWMLWREIGLRGTGLPSNLVLDLAPPDCAAAADQVLDAEARIRVLREQALSSARSVLEQMRSAAIKNRREDKSLVKIIRALKEQRVPKIDEAMPSLRAEIDSLQTETVRLNRLTEDFQKVFQEGLEQTSRAIRTVSKSDLFSKAIIWQNRRAYHRGIVPLLRGSFNGSRGSKRRQHEEMAANYLQRYCLKNETIGFFGPVGWAQVGQTDTSLVERVGPNLIASSKLYYEVWGIDALSRALSKDGRLHPWIPPRVMPFVCVEGATIHGLARGPIKLGSQQLITLRACDGRRSAKEIAAELVRLPSSGLTTPESVYRLLAEMVDLGLIAWHLEVPLDLHPELYLRRFIEGVDDDSIRHSSLAKLDRLLAAGSAVSQHTDDAEALDEKLEKLESVFIELTGKQPTRSAGKTYAARTILYEDCRRGTQVQLGLNFIQSIGPPLSLLLSSARWFTYEMANRYRKAFEQVYAELVSKTSSTSIGFPAFWARVRPLFFAEENPSTILLKEFQNRWRLLLPFAHAQHKVTYSCEDVREGVDKVFDAPRPGWASARYHSPDILIDAASVDDIRHGKYSTVLGELHMAVNTLSWNLFIEHHPSPEKLLLAVTRDFQAPRIIPVIAKSVHIKSARLIPGLITPSDFRLVLTPEPHNVPDSQVVQAGEVVIQKEGNSLLARTRDGRLSADIIELFSEGLTGKAASLFKMIETAPHTPRISFDRMIVHRETWCFSPAELTFANEMEDQRRFLAARRWARSLGIPRFVFVKVASEAKPFYVDFDSPIYISIFAKAIRHCNSEKPTDVSVKVVEMLPKPCHTWLPDAADNHYASELRAVALDMTGLGPTQH